MGLGVSYSENPTCLNQGICHESCSCIELFWALWIHSTSSGLGFMEAIVKGLGFGDCNTSSAVYMDSFSGKMLCRENHKTSWAIPSP